MQNIDVFFEKIFSLQQNIFNENYENLNTDVTNLIQILLDFCKLGSEENVLQLNFILTELLETLENKDYLLLADILEYRLAIFVKQNYKEA